jgi:hypothetical protein
MKTNLATTLIVGTEVKTCETIVAHVEEDLGNTPQPPTWRAKCLWVFVSQEHGVPCEGPKGFERRGCMREIYSATKHGDGRLDTPESTPPDIE